MNYINHLSLFYARLHKETRLNATHISLYLALFQCWNSYRFENPFPLWRERIMRLSGIGARSTYGKCLKELHQFGYIIFSQSLHRYHWPKVSIVHLAGTPGVSLPSLFRPGIVKAPRDQGTSPEQPPGPILSTSPSKSEQIPGSDFDTLQLKIGDMPVPVLGHINKQYINKVNGERETRAQTPSSDSQGGMQTNTPAGTERAIPSREEAYNYFKQAGYPETEAALFFNHYRANGWKLGGKAPITDWQGAAEKWMEYAKNLKNQSYAKSGKQNGTAHLHVDPNTDYSQPL